MKKPTLKDVIQGQDWEITKIKTLAFDYRIDARRRFFKPEGINTFSKWGSKKYINRLYDSNMEIKLEHLVER